MNNELTPQELRKRVAEDIDWDYLPTSQWQAAKEYITRLEVVAEAALSFDSHQGPGCFYQPPCSCGFDQLWAALQHAGYGDE